MKLKHLHYGWVMVVVSVGVLATHMLPFYTFGIFLTPLTMEFNWDRGPLSAALSMSMLVSGGLAIFIGRISDKYGPRVLVTVNGLLTGIGFLLMSQVSSLWQVYLIWGLLMAVASSCSFIPVISTIPRWFAKRRGMATGLTLTGLSLGGIISPPLAQWLISSYSWQQAYVILGLITIIIVVPLAQFMKHSPQRVGLKPYGESGGVEDKHPPASVAEGLSLKQAIQTGQFWFFGLILFGHTFYSMVIMVHIAPHAVDIGISATMAAIILSIYSGTNVIGRLSVGFICDRIGARVTLSACLITVTLALIWLLFSRDAWMFYLFAVIFGIAYSGVFPIQMLLPAELFGLKFLGIILATIMFFGTIGGAVGAPLAGSIFDVTGSYSLAFLISAILSALAFVLSLVLLKAKGWRGGD